MLSVISEDYRPRILIPGNPLQMYADVAKQGAKLLEEAYQVLHPKSTPVTSCNSSGHTRGDWISLNTLSFPRQEVVRIPLNRYDGRSTFSISEAQEDSGFVIAKDGSGNCMTELVRLAEYRANIAPATGKSKHLVPAMCRAR